MSAQHTPGPWIAGHKLENSIVTDTLQHGEWAVADVNIVRAESVANARLIAAAPDLLEALQFVMSTSELGCVTEAVVRAAIDKATRSST